MCGTDASYLWGFIEKSLAHCAVTRTTAISMGFAISDLITDLLVLVTPIPLVWQLQKGRAEKLQICGIFALGLLSVNAFP